MKCRGLELDDVSFQAKGVIRRAKYKGHARLVLKEYGRDIWKSRVVGPFVFINVVSLCDMDVIGWGRSHMAY